MNDQPNTNWPQRREAFFRRHPGLLFVIVLVTGFLVGPLMMAVGRMTAVLYKDF
jgi:hypothetical protein